MILPQYVKEKLTLDIKQLLLSSAQQNAMTQTAFFEDKITADQFKEKIEEGNNTTAALIVALVEDIGKK